VERLVAGPFDGGECLTRVGGLGLKRAPATTCLDDHDADRVCDHVVELTCDPRALLGDRRRRIRLLLLDVLAQTPAPDRSTRYPRGAEEEC
jgi:hypothetical protein